MNDCISNLLSVEGSIFKEILKTLLTTVIYEEHKVIWVFQKPLFPTIVINGKDNYELVKAEILQNEFNDDLRKKIDEELELLSENIFVNQTMSGTPDPEETLTLSKYNKEKFSSNFSRFKNNLVKFK